MAKRKAAGPTEEISQTTGVKKTGVSHSAGSTNESSVLANYDRLWPLDGPVPDQECLFAPVLEMLKIVRSTSGEIRTKPFLVACRHTTPITLQFRGTFDHVRWLIPFYVAEMERIYESNPCKFEHLYSLVDFDVKTSTFHEQCMAVSLVWLTRYMDFVVELFRNLLEHPDWITFQACYYAFDKTLRKWRDRKTVKPEDAPDKEELLKVIGGNGDVMGDIEKFCTSFTPLLEQNHKFLASLGMDELTLPDARLGKKLPSTYSKKEKMGKTMFAPALEELECVKSQSGEILTKHFLESCNKILPVIVNFGEAVSDVEQRICYFAERLLSIYSSNPSKFNYLYSFVKFEIESDAVNQMFSNTSALNLLIRRMDFVVELFRNLVEHPEWITFEACNDSYGKTLKRWHEQHKRFDRRNEVISQYAPDREEFMEVIGGNGDVMADMKKFCDIFTPLLKQTDKFLASSGLDKSQLIDGEAC